jgi:hypothetical protein
MKMVAVIVGCDFWEKLGLRGEEGNQDNNDFSGRKDGQSKIIWIC